MIDMMFMVVTMMMMMMMMTTKHERWWRGFQITQATRARAAHAPVCSFKCYATRLGLGRKTENKVGLKGGFYRDTVGVGVGGGGGSACGHTNQRSATGPWRRGQG